MSPPDSSGLRRREFFEEGETLPGRAPWALTELSDSMYFFRSHWLNGGLDPSNYFRESFLSVDSASIFPRSADERLHTLLGKFGGLVFVGKGDYPRRSPIMEFTE